MHESASGKAGTPTVSSSKELSESWLREKYHEDGLTTREIGELVGFSGKTIRNRMEDYGISRRDSGKPAVDERLQDESWFRQKYEEEGLSTTDIAELSDAAVETVMEWKRKHGIESKTEYKSRGTGEDNPNGGEYIQTECEWCGESLTLPERQIERAENNFCSHQCNASYRSVHIRGEDHPLYVDGSHENFGPNWRQARQDARERDNHTCQSCGITEDALTRELHVHHIIPRRKFDSPAEANDLNNLVSLCASCHRAYEGVPIRPKVIDE